MDINAIVKLPDYKKCIEICRLQKILPQLCVVYAYCTYIPDIQILINR